MNCTNDQAARLPDRATRLFLVMVMGLAIPCLAHSVLAEPPVGVDAMTMDQKVMCFMALRDELLDANNDHRVSALEIPIPQFSEDQWQRLETTYDEVKFKGGAPWVRSLADQCVMMLDSGLARARVGGKLDTAAGCTALGFQLWDSGTTDKVQAHFGRLEFEIQSILLRRMIRETAKSTYLGVIAAQAAVYQVPEEQKAALRGCATFTSLADDSGRNAYPDALPWDAKAGGSPEQHKVYWDAWRRSADMRTVGVCSAVVDGTERDMDTVWLANQLKAGRMGLAGDASGFVDALRGYLRKTTESMPQDVLDRIRGRCTRYTDLRH